ncbi:MAG: InlB B-repeat-containing protein [Algoriphagus aquaeductus]|uniref:InlB B-repeat-containing protein n=1 Tax=Algoriphagus aquaeductus TaxID=475299 RepID=UPI00391B8160
MLILLKQSPTGLFASDAYGQTVEIYEQLWFDTVSLGLVTNTITEANMLPFEMNTGQLIYVDGTTEYRYDGSGGFTTVTAPTTPVFTISLSVAPSGGGTASDLTATGPYEAGESVSLSASAATDFTFVSWTRNGVVISTNSAFTYLMPASNVALVANFIADEDIPEPEPTPEPVELPATFYDLELRVKGIQIPMPPFVQKKIEGMLSDVFEGEYSYPVDIPLSPREMIAIGLPNDPQTASSFTEPIPADIWSHGNLRYKGFIDILKSDEERIRTSFILDSGFFISQNKSLTIPQCYSADDAIDLSGQTIYAVGGYELRFNYRDLRLTVNTFTKNFLKAQYETHLDMLEAMAEWLSGLSLNLRVSIEYSEDETDETSKIIYWDTTTVTTCTLAPTTGTSRFTRARKLTSRRFAMEEWGQVNEANRIAFPTVYNRNLYEGNNALHDGIVNRYDEAGRLYVSNVRYLTYSESFRWEHTIIPFLYLTDIVKQIFKFLKIEVSGEFFDSDLVKRMLMYNNRTLDFVSVKINGTPSRRTALAIFHGDGNPDNESYFYENIHDFQIKLANHAPDYSVIDFLKGLKNYFGLKYDFNILQNRVEIRFVRSKIRAREVLDLTRQAGRVFTLHHGKESGFQFVYDNPDPLMADGASNPPPSGGVGGGEDYTVQNYLALDSLDAELFEIAYVESLRAWFQLVPDQSNPPFWKLYAFRQQSDLAAPVGVSTDRNSNKRAWNLTLFPLVDSWISGKKMPAIECTANNREVKLENKQCGLRIFAFYGVQESADGHPYPFASCTRYDAQELLSEDQYDLDIRSEDMYPLHADQERIITAGKEYETTLTLDNYKLLQLSRSPIIRIANLDYLIEDTETQNTSKEFAIAKARLYKIK